MGRRRKRKLKKKVKKFLIMFLITTIIIIISTATYKNISKKSPSKEKTIVIKKNTSFKDKIKNVHMNTLIGIINTIKIIKS